MESIEDLPDDAIILIMNCIENVRERKRLGRVSKRWRILSSLSLKSQRILTKKEHIAYESEIRKYQNPYAFREKPQLCRILYFCPNVTRVDSLECELMDLRPEKEYLKRNQTYKITSLSVHQPDARFRDKDLVWLFKRCPNLKELSIYPFVNLTGTCLLSLGNSVEKFQLLYSSNHCTCVSYRRQKGLILRKFQQFFESRGRNIKIFKEETFIKFLPDFFQNAKNVEEIHLSGFHWNDTKSLPVMPYLTNLTIDQTKFFRYHYEKWNDESLTNLLKMCPNLTRFQMNLVENYGTISNRSIESLVKWCRKLKEIRMGSIKLTSDSFERLSSLPELSNVFIENCKGIGNGYVHLLSKSNSVQNITLFRCEIVKEDLMSEINQIDLNIGVFEAFYSQILILDRTQTMNKNLIRSILSLDIPIKRHLKVYINLLHKMINIGCRFQPERNRTIDELPDDAIILIINYVENVRERKRLGRVSKRWQVLSSISLRSQKQITRIEHICYEKEIRANAFGLFFDNPQLCKILTICPNVKKVDSFGCGILDLKPQRSVLKRKQVFKITDLVIKDSLNNLSDKDLIWIFKKSPNLKELTIYLFRRFTGSCLLFVGDSIEKFKLFNRNIYQAPVYEAILLRKFQEFFEKRGSNIKRFKEEGFSYILPFVFENATNIERISISGYYSLLNGLGVVPITAGLNNLTDLCIDHTKNFLHYEKMDDTTLMGILRICPNLTKFSITSGINDGITDTSILSLADCCKNLRKIYIKSVNLTSVAFETLSSLSELSEICIEDCQEMGNGYMQFFKKCQKLKNIKLIRCGIIKEDLIAEINKINIQIRIFNPFDSQEVYYINY